MTEQSKRMDAALLKREEKTSWRALQRLKKICRRPLETVQEKSAEENREQKHRVGDAYVRKRNKLGGRLKTLEEDRLISCGPSAL